MCATERWITGATTTLISEHEALRATAALLLDKFVLNLIRFLYKKLRVCYNRKNDRGGNTVYEFDY